MYLTGSDMKIYQVLVLIIFDNSITYSIVISFRLMQRSVRSYKRSYKRDTPASPDDGGLPTIN
jgi:hypothetical protein